MNYEFVNAKSLYTTFRLKYRSFSFDYSKPFYFCTIFILSIVHKYKAGQIEQILKLANKK